MSDPAAADYYARVGVDPAADSGRVRSAVRAAQKRCHPDHNDSPDSRTQFRRVMEAADCLTDREERAAYDTFHGRLGASRATEAFERWTARGRFQSPEQFASGFAGTASARRTTGAGDGRTRDARGDRREREASGTGPNQASSTTHERRSTRSERSSDSRGSTGREAAPDGRDTTGAETSSESATDSRRTHSNFGHRRTYERNVYDPPGWRSFGRWPRIEIGLLARDLGALASLALAVGAGLIATTVLGFVYVVGIYAVGTALAVVEALLRTAGVVRFDAYTVAEIGLTWLLELGVYVGVFLACAALAALLFERDWDDHLGNGLGFPPAVLLLPSAALAGGALWLNRGAAHLSLSPTVDPLAGALVIAVVWPVVHRGTRLLFEAPPNHGGESMLDSVGAVLFHVGTGALLFAGYLLGARAVVGELSEPLEYTLLAKHLPPRLLLGVGAGAAGVSLLSALVASLWSLARR